MMHKIGIFFLLFPLFFGSFLEARPLIKKFAPGEPLPADIFIQMAKIINPTVVNISTSQSKSPSTAPYFNDPFFDFFFSPFPRLPNPQMRSLGTGFIIRESGLILTNTHVIERADTIQVQLENSKKFHTAKVMGKDKTTDIAIIKISTDTKLPVAFLGNSSELQVGEWVAAFGNPYGHGHTMTKGIISAVNREIDELSLMFGFLQTDAIINPGNSGGPLVNTKGEVIGINTAMRTQGISFAIPIDNVKVVLKELETHGRMRRGFIGVQMSEYRQNENGVLVLNVIPETPAEKAGVRTQDLIVRFNNKAIKNYKDLLKAVASTPVNQTVPIELMRQGKRLKLNITVAERGRLSAQNPATGKTKKAPFDLGIAMITGTKEVLQSIGLPPLSQSHPIVTKVKPGSPAGFAGLQKKDIILKVNGWRVRTAREVQKRLLRHRTNTLNILRYRPYSRQYVSMIFQLTAR